MNNTYEFLETLIEILNTDKKINHISVYNHEEDNGKKYDDLHHAYLNNNITLIQEYIDKLVKLGQH